MELKGKSVLMVVAPLNFRDEELLNTKKVLENYGAEVEIGSLGVAEAKGSLGAVVGVEIDISGANVEDYDAIVFVGGPGTDVYFNEEMVLNIVREANNKGKILGAICIAPVILANAGILKGKKATVFPSGKDVLKSKGAEYTGEPVTSDSNIVTANGPAAAADFGEAIAEKLFERT